MSELRVVLFGGTDLTHAVARRLADLAIPIAGVVHVEERFRISYSSTGVKNVRHYDLRSWAEERSIRTHVWTNAASALRFVQDVRGTWGLAAGWYHMLPAALRNAFAYGCAGIHASLLPKLRGGAPLNWAILSGATETGVSLFVLGDGVDDGPILGQRRFRIGDRTKVGELVELSTAAALDLVTSVAPQLAAGTITPTPQAGVPSYCLQRVPEDGWIDWTGTATQIDRLIRALGHPYPGAFTSLDGDRIAIWGSAISDAEVCGVPGQVFVIGDNPSPCVVTGAGALVIGAATDSRGEDAIPTLRSSAHRRFDVRRQL